MSVAPLLLHGSPPANAHLGTTCDQLGCRAPWVPFRERLETSDTDTLTRANGAASAPLTFSARAPVAGTEHTPVALRTGSPGPALDATDAPTPRPWP
ncbi:hypothetical protein SCA03_66270 [Streptomyces cacaoi]|uniref:Uncharacterized protein n=1 Tax=Streptomyces cacaoi TaxID=1898 RepID=A0A4Y3R8L0_STRCI|nr:hypothetical protein SCA03_66270 [Streptomyces cacaoi]